MSQDQSADRADYDPLWITGKALERHFDPEKGPCSSSPGYSGTRRMTALGDRRRGFPRHPAGKHPD